MVEHPLGWRLACSTCGSVFPVKVYLQGCPACARAGRKGALLVQNVVQKTPISPKHQLGIWANWAQWLPVVPVPHQITLGEGNTPLLRVEALAATLGCRDLYLKIEPLNPTGSFKDRFHAVTAAVAATLGMRGVVAASTGNHGLALSAYATAHGLAAVVVGHPDMPSLLQRAIRFLGGMPLLTTSDIADETIREMVEKGDWLPATMVWPISAPPNPYGVEGYKTIAYEIYRDLGGRMPDRVFAPTSGGDLLTGLWRGQNDLQRAGFDRARSRLVACQPAGAAPLVAALEEGLNTVPTLAHTDTIALSIGDPCTGQLALEAIRETEGDALAVTDSEILDAGRELARFGILAEPSSAASVAALRRELEHDPEMRDETVVCVLTSSALKWLDHYGPMTKRTGWEVQSRAAALNAVTQYVDSRQS